MKRKIFFYLLAMLLLSTSSVHAETINLSVAASMTEAFNEIITAFSKNHPGLAVQPNYGSSGALAKQINQGAPGDLFVSANEKWMSFLVEKGDIAPGTEHIFAYNKLVFTGLKREKEMTMESIVELKLIAIGSPESVPAGQYAKQAMEAAGIYATLEKNKKLVMAKDVRQALIYADRGEVDGAFVYKTDALLAKKAEILFTVPDELYSRVSYPLALTTAGAKKPSALSFYKYLASPEAIAIFIHHGFEPAK